MSTRRAQERPFFPFSVRSRNCIGNFVARFNLVALTTLIFGRYKASLHCKPESMRDIQSLVLRPKTKLEDCSTVGVPIRFTRRGYLET